MFKLILNIQLIFVFLSPNNKSIKIHPFLNAGAKFRVSL
jgi:hypothetical protein